MYFEIVFDEGEWRRLEDAGPMLDGSPRTWDGVWGVWSVDYGIVPDFYHKGRRPKKQPAQ